jgi:hypothetical protein
MNRTLTDVFHDLYNLETRTQRLLRLAHRNDPDPNADPNGGAVGGDPNQDHRARRERELQGAAADALKGQVISLEQDVKKQREEIAAYKRQIKEREAQTAELETYKAFGKPDDLKTRLEQFERDTAELTGFRRERAVHAAAKVTKLEDGRQVSAEKLWDIVKLKGFDIALEESLVTGDDGKPVKGQAAFVTEGEGKKTPLLEYVKREFPTFVDYLAADDASAGKEPSGGSGARVAAQASGGSGAKGAKTVDEIAAAKRSSGTYRM